MNWLAILQLVAAVGYEPTPPKRLVTQTSLQCQTYWHIMSATQTYVCPHSAFCCRFSASLHPRRVKPKFWPLGMWFPKPFPRPYTLDAQNLSLAIRLTVFLVAYTQLYKPLCWLVGPSVAVHEALMAIGLVPGISPKNKVKRCSFFLSYNSVSLIKLVSWILACLNNND